MLEIRKGNQVILGRDRPQIVLQDLNPFTISWDPMQVIFNDIDHPLTDIPYWKSIPLQGKLVNTYFPCSLHIFSLKNLLPQYLLSRKILRRIFSPTERFIIFGSLITTLPHFWIENNIPINKVEFFWTVWLIALP